MSLGKLHIQCRCWNEVSWSQLNQFGSVRQHHMLQLSPAHKGTIKATTLFNTKENWDTSLRWCFSTTSINNEKFHKALYIQRLEYIHTEFWKGTIVEMHFLHQNAEAIHLKCFISIRNFPNASLGSQLWQAKTTATILSALVQSSRCAFMANFCVEQIPTWNKGWRSTLHNACKFSILRLTVNTLLMYISCGQMITLFCLLFSKTTASGGRPTNKPKWIPCTCFRELHRLKFTELNLAGYLTLINGGSIPYYQDMVSQPPSEIITGVWFKGVPDIYDKQDGTHFPNHIDWMI